ncbi:MAG: hypothetical protein IT267_09940 [Saprospiraceae bacterium]|nr:hypothetical protein [Saprospiraceae bacterium]
MNTKQIIASVVGALILFIWQFLSWAAIPIHSDVYGYTASQDKILEVLNQSNLEEGTYMLPGVPPGTSHEDAEKQGQASIGKPWAQVSYHKSFDISMGMNMTRGFLVDLIALFLLSWIFLRLGKVNMQTSIFVCVSIGLIAYLTIPYLNSIWFGGSTLGHLIDALVPWGLVGVWLGWYMNRS